MKCPYCYSNTNKVIDKRESDDNRTTRRRRECLKCSKRFTTFERVETIDLLVVKKDGRREHFDRNKLRLGIVKSCEKRPVSAEVIDSTVDKIESDLRKLSGKEIHTKKLGDLVMKHLKKVDDVAYIRFASVYRQFTDLNDFEKELASLTNSLRTRKTTTRN